MKFNSRFPALLYFASAVFALAMFSSCRTSKKIVETPNATLKLKGTQIIQVFDSMMNRQIRFHYLTAKANVDFTDKTGETNSFDINLRVCQDSAIWISITPLLGIEAARLMVTHDSVILLDRVHKTVTKRDFAFFEDQLKTNVSFDMLQAVIVGNYFQYQKNEKIKSMYEEEPYVILSSLNKRQMKRSLEEKDPTKPIVQDFWIDGNYRIARSRITDDRQNRYVEASYKNFTDVNGYLFPLNFVVTLASSTPTIMKIEYSKVNTVEELQMPFTVPEKYEVK